MQQLINVIQKSFKDFTLLLWRDAFLKFTLFKEMREKSGLWGYVCARERVCVIMSKGVWVFLYVCVCEKEMECHMRHFYTQYCDKRIKIYIDNFGSIVFFTLWIENINFGQFCPTDV